MSYSAKKIAERSAFPLAWRVTLLCVLATIGSASTFGSTNPAADGRSGSAGFPFAIADFDGDRRPDIARVQMSGAFAGDTRYAIDFELTTGLEQRVFVHAPSGGLSLISRDVNGDHFPDLVVMTARTGSPVAVLINDGRGNFRQSDASSFPEVFAASERSINAPWNQCPDRCAAVFPRVQPWECATCNAFSSIQNVAGWIVGLRLSSASPAGRNAFLGRAPPSLLL